MRILFLAPRFPLPTLKGDKLRAWQFLRLLGRDHEVTLLSYIATRQEHDMKPAVEDRCRVVTVPFAGTRRAMGLLAAPIRPYPLQALLHESAPIKRHLAALLPQCDAVHCNTLRMAPNLPSEMEKPLVVDFIDALSQSYDRRAGAAGFPISQAFRWEAKRLQALESGLIRRAAFTCAVSAEDAAVLGEGVLPVPHGVDTQAFGPPPPGAERSHIIFAGNLRYPPNVEGAIELATRIYPQVREAVPGTQLHLVGADPSPRVRRLQGNGIEVTGYVPNMADELRKSALTVVPIRSGGGVKTKILEAMACATPVIATPMAMAGIDARGGLDALIAEGSRDLAAHTIALLKDREEARQIGRNGRELVERNFSWQATGRVLLERYAELEASLS